MDHGLRVFYLARYEFASETSAVPIGAAFLETGINGHTTLVATLSDGRQASDLGAGNGTGLDKYSRPFRVWRP